MRWADEAGFCFDFGCSSAVIPEQAVSDAAGDISGFSEIPSLRTQAFFQ